MIVTTPRFEFELLAGHGDTADLFNLHRTVTVFADYLDLGFDACQVDATDLRGIFRIRYLVGILAKICCYGRKLVVFTSSRAVVAVFGFATEGQKQSNE